MYALSKSKLGEAAAGTPFARMIFERPGAATSSRTRFIIIAALVWRKCRLSPKEILVRMPINRRSFFQSSIAANAAFLGAGCSSDIPSRDLREDARASVKSPYQYGAIGNGKSDDTLAVRSAYEAALSIRGSVDMTGGRFYIPGHVEIEEPGVDLVCAGGGVIGGGEVRIGPTKYDAKSGGVDFSGTRVSGVIFDRGEDFGNSRCLVLRNVRGLDITDNSFQSAGKGIAVETADGNDKFHTSAMVRISGNRFSKLKFGVFGDTAEWDRLSDWHITDNYFNYCSDTSVWIASTEDVSLGGVDGLNFAGNTVFSFGSESQDPLFAVKRYNLRLGKTNWLRIINNNFFEAGLSAVYLDTPQFFVFTGNHVAWPGQRELADALEIRNGSPTGIVQDNTFAQWTRAAVGLYDLADAARVEIGQNGWSWTESPHSWKGEGSLPGFRVFLSSNTHGYPIIRDFQAIGAHDDLKGQSLMQSRDPKTPKGGVSGMSRSGVSVPSTITLFGMSDIVGSSNFGGLMSVTATNSSDESLIATYLLFLSSQGSVCSVVQSGGFTDGDFSGHPSFSWSLSGTDLQATPIGLTNDTFDFDGVMLGAAAPSVA
jgi:hypothetical protein